jgi:hypothetical protein
MPATCAILAPWLTLREFLQEDAHITDLELDPATRTSLFSIFDGHGGKAVAKFCAQHLVSSSPFTATRVGRLAQSPTSAPAISSLACGRLHPNQPACVHALLWCRHVSW